MSTISDTKEAPTPTDGPFHIVCDKQPSDPVMWVGVCINDPEALMAQIDATNREMEYFDAEPVTTPYLLVVSSLNGVEIDRKIAPLDDGIVHMAFRRAGTFTLHATVVWPDWGGESGLKRIFRGRNSSGNYDTSMMWDGELNDSFSRNRSRSRQDRAWRIPFVATQEVVVLANNFAKEPPAWLTSWTEWFFSEKGRDNCDFRKRYLRLLPYSVSVLPTHYVAKFIALLAFTITGYVYNLNWKAAFAPFRQGTFNDVFGSVKRKSWWNYKRSAKGTIVERKFAYGVPLVIAAVANVVALIVDIFEEDFGYGESLLAVLGVCVVLVVCLVVVALLVNVVEWYKSRSRNAASTSWHSNFRRKRRESRARKAMTEREQLARELNTMSCTVAGKPVTITQLVERRKSSPVVIGNRLKDRVCLPFQEK